MESRAFPALCALASMLCGFGGMAVVLTGATWAYITVVVGLVVGAAVIGPVLWRAWPRRTRVRP